MARVRALRCQVTLVKYNLIDLIKYSAADSSFSQAAIMNKIKRTAQ